VFLFSNVDVFSLVNSIPVSVLGSGPHDNKEFILRLAVISNNRAIHYLNKKIGRPAAVDLSAPDHR